MRGGTVRVRLLGFVAALVLLASIPFFLFDGRPSGQSTDDTLAALRDEALRLQRAAHFEAASDAWLRLAQLDQHRVEAWLRWGETLHLMGREHRAYARFHALHREHPGDPVFAFLHAYAHMMETGNWRSHERAFARAIALDPENPWPRAFQYARQTHESDEERGRALAGLDRCLEIAPGNGPCLVARGRTRLRTGDPVAAAEDLARALEAEAGWIDPAGLRLDLMRALFEAHRPEEAVAAATRAFEAFEQQGDRPALLRLVAGIAARDQAEELDPRSEKALEHLKRRVEAIRQRICGPATGYLSVLCHRARAAALRRQERPAEAIHEIDRTLEILRDFDSPLLVAQLLVERCRLSTSLGHYEDALPDCEAAEKILLENSMFSEAFAPLHWRVHLHRDRGETDLALRLAHRYVRLAREYGWQGEPVSALDDLVWIALGEGDFDTALKAFEEMRRRVDRAGAWTYQVAELYEAMADYRGALSYYQRGLSGEGLSSSGRKMERLRSLHGLARVRLALGDTTLARAFASSYQDKYLGDPGLAFLPVPNLAEVLLAEGQPFDALRAARAVVRSARSSGTSRKVALARAELARVHLSLGSYREAARELTALLPQYEELGMTREQGDALLLLALARLELGDPEGAMAPLREARSLVASTFEPETQWRIAHLEGRILEARGDVSRALAAYGRAIAILEAIRFRLPPGPLRSGFLAPRFDPYEAAIRLHLIGGRKDVALPLALMLAERKRARDLRDHVLGGASTIFSREERRITRLTPTLSKEHGWEQTREERVRDTGLTIDPWTTSSAGTVEDSLRWTDAIRLALGPSQALVEYTFVRDTLWAFVVRRKGLTAHRLAIPRQRLRSRIEELNVPLDALAEGRITLAQAAWPLETARELFRALLEPLEEDLVGAVTLLIVPEDELWRVPFDGLVTQMPFDSPQAGDPVLFERYERASYLIDRYATAYLPSAEWLLLAGSRTDRAGVEGMLVLGAPVESTRGTGHPIPLPLALEEARRVAGVWPDSRVLVGTAATESRFREIAPDYRYVHLAAHALADPVSPGSSGIVLAGDNKNDGFLSALEITRMSLAAELVTLSACQTGKGPIRAGEGILALSRAFLQAGVPTVLATQWSIPDAAGSIMPDFYAYLLQSGDPVASLRRAKVEFRAHRESSGGRIVSRAHPIYWAPFVLVGRPTVGLPPGATASVPHTSSGRGTSSP